MTRVPRKARAFIDEITKEPPLRFDRMIARARLDPASHLRSVDWAETDFSSCDLRGFDFSRANIAGCDFADALIENGRFDGAIVDVARPYARINPKRTNLRAAKDWDAYAKAWRRAADPPPDDHLPVGVVFQDAPFGPEMVVVPEGEFRMGSDVAPARHNDGVPQHRVTIGRPFAVGRFAVTFEEWDWAEAHSEWQKHTKLEPRRPDDSQWGRGRRPVINLDWDDAQAYCRWLSAVTGKPYRLPSEAEWEYCCRAGTTTAYNTGDTITREQAQFEANQTREVGAFPANPWGLHDMHGNAWEWCEDAWHDSYDGAPDDGSPRLGGGDSSLRVLRGGSGVSITQFLRSAHRSAIQPGHRSGSIGFRLVRTL